MRLLRSTDLALRVLMRLAVVGGPTPTTREVAEDMGVPYTHTAKIVAELQHMGLLDARPPPARRPALPRRCPPAGGRGGGRAGARA
ncbi:Rrf2 family transcriptional regulator, partial [Streptomyces sp. NPDC059378]|uniref:Rrf2 family transcriptional regulator n=1 Tax=Streptomyces sp. NPDC059378 TaxID=3346815 RepID=UPI0036D0CF45